MYVALALLSSLVLGAADFVGGLTAKQARAAVVVVWSNLAGLATAVVLALSSALPGRSILPGARRPVSAAAWARCCSTVRSPRA